MSAYTDAELNRWLRTEFEQDTNFSRAIAAAAFLADEAYGLLRPALLKLKDSQSRSSALSTVLDRETNEEKGHDPSGPRIRCPICRWSPSKQDLWSCTCGHEWNTFDTGGVCPACLHQWTETQCLSCSYWSPHSLWYREANP